MANHEHIEVVRRGANATWSWRGGSLDLRDADLSGVQLRGALLDRADLRGARLVGADLSGSRMQESRLSNAHLIRSKLDDVRFGGGSLDGALLCSASLRRATLVRTDFSTANLTDADFEGARMSYARFGGAILNHTKLVDAELSGVIGLDQVTHEGPSEIGTHALLRFGTGFPTEFLRGVGLPDSFIRYLPAIIASARPVDFFSVYIAAAEPDNELARRLYNDLQSAGVRCWFRHFRSDSAEPDQMVRLHERTIVLWSRHAVSDARVRWDAAAGADPSTTSTILLLLDDSFIDQSARPQIDFRNWRDFRSYCSAFALLNDALAQTRA